MLYYFINVFIVTIFDIALDNPKILSSFPERLMSCIWENYGGRIVIHIQQLLRNSHARHFYSDNLNQRF